MMASQLIPVNFNKIMQSKSYTVFILGTDEKKFAIYTDPHVGQNIQTYLTEQTKPRPYTYDLMNLIFKGLDVKILQVILFDVEDTVYYARLFLEQGAEEKTILEIDARPSDCLTLALMNNIPIFCRKELLEKVIPVED
jgi:hypothetical protein